MDDPARELEGHIYQDQFISPKECERFAQFIMETEDEVKATGPDIYLGTAPNSLTGRHKTHNYLYTELGEILTPRLQKVFRDQGYPSVDECKRVVAVQCWANIFRKGEGISSHCHNDGTCLPYLCANLFISGPADIGTTYICDGKEITLPNEPGVITVFSDRTYHYVKKNPYDTPRISMAMDFHVNNFVAPRYKNVDPHPERS